MIVTPRWEFLDLPLDWKVTLERMSQVHSTDPKATPSARCFLCGAAFRSDCGEPINGGEGVELCRACGAIYEHPALCC